jgi:hypothetical protein
MRIEFPSHIRRIPEEIPIHHRTYIPDTLIGHRRFYWKDEREGRSGWFYEEISPPIGPLHFYQKYVWNKHTETWSIKRKVNWKTTTVYGDIKRKIQLSKGSVFDSLCDIFWQVKISDWLKESKIKREDNTTPSLSRLGELN